MRISSAEKPTTSRLRLWNFSRKRFFVENAKHGVFAVAGWHDRDAQIDEAALVPHAEAAVLRDAALGDVEIAHHLDTGKDRGVPFLREGCMACCRTPSMRYLTATSASRASMWMSLARRSSAVKMMVSTRRTTGLDAWCRA